MKSVVRWLKWSRLCKKNLSVFWINIWLFYNCLDVRCPNSKYLKTTISLYIETSILVSYLTFTEMWEYFQFLNKNKECEWYVKMLPTITIFSFLVALLEDKN